MTDSEPSETGVIRLTNAEEFVETSKDLLNPVIRNINILTTDFEREWFGHTSVTEALKKAVITNRRVTLRILVADPTKAIKTKHPLIPLIRKLSRIEARVIQEEILEKQPMKQSFCLVDRSRLIVRQSFDQFMGFAHFEDKHSVKNFNEMFDQYWRFSSTHADLRHVYV